MANSYIPFWERYEANVVQGDGCWEWAGTHSAEGYSQIKRDTHLVYAHRVAYEREHGPIPRGLTIDHLCRNTGCVNPAHLEAVSMRENILRGTSPSAIAARQTHCPRGHAYTHRSPDGHRRCRSCDRIRLGAAERQGEQA